MPPTDVLPVSTSVAELTTTRVTWWMSILDASDFSVSRLELEEDEPLDDSILKQEVREKRGGIGFVLVR